MFADSSLRNQLAFADVATYTFLEVDSRASNRAGGATLLADLAHFALLYPLDAERREKRSHAQSRTQWAGITAIETTDKS